MTHFAPRLLRLESPVFQAFSLWIMTASIAANLGIVLAAAITMTVNTF